MSEYRDPYPRTPTRGAFFVNLHGDDALSQTQQTVSAVPVEPHAVEVPAAPQPEPPASSSVPAIADASVDAPPAAPEGELGS